MKQIIGIISLSLLYIFAIAQISYASGGACDIKEVKKGYKCVSCSRILRGWECADCKKTGKDCLFEEAALKDGLKCPNCSGKITESDLVINKACIFCKKEVVEVEWCIKRLYACPKHPKYEQARPEACTEEITEGKSAKKCGTKFQLSRIVPAEVVFCNTCPKCRKFFNDIDKCASCKQTLTKKKVCGQNGVFPHIRDFFLNENGVKQNYTKLAPPVGLAMSICIDYEAGKSELARIKQAVELFSSFLWENTGGNMYLKEAVLANNAKGGYISIQRLSSESGGHANSDKAIAVSSNLLNVGSPESGNYVLGMGILHEFYHSMFHLPDEYLNNAPIRDCVMDPRSKKLELCDDCKEKLADRFRKWDLSGEKKPGKVSPTQFEIITDK